MHDAFAPIRPASLDWHDGRPFNNAFGDGYSAREDGIGESRLVFLHGNRLTERFGALPADGQFVIGETGFGTGTKLLLAAGLFLEQAPETARLSLLSAELHPLTHSDLERALPADLPLREHLLAQYPALTPGFHRLDLHPRISLTLMFGDAMAMWQRQSARVDAWFLDGFAPARNPAMWRPELLAELFTRSRPGATLATFTVAGRVRRALAETGFELTIQAGFGRKRERLEGHAPGQWQPRHARHGHAVVAGAGLAGATTARALAERGWQVQVLDPGGVASAASGNRAGVVYTTPSGSASAQNRWYQGSYLYSLRTFERHGLERRGIGRFGGVIQRVVSARQRRKLESALESGIWTAQLLAWLDGDHVRLARAGSLQPPLWCRWLLDHPAIGFQARPLTRLAVEADALVLCVGGQTGSLAPLAALPLTRIRGQVTEIRATAESAAWRETLCHDGYLSPAFDGVHCVGASFDLESQSLDPCAGDDTANVERLATHLPERWQGLGGTNIEVVGNRVGLRCQPRDYLPVVGELPGAANEAPHPILLNLGHGSRGITGTPLAAAYIADRLSGLPSPLDDGLVAALSPSRLWPREPGVPDRPSPPAAESR
ncbi:MAG: FAD-dependent 5-carboxymethylaminomethyl-2-thiouridine(34) oxidoreductase MnmC [Wenzhouxiangellaceae bacterium]|nr:FAD-dependent 5-carboxymethylaminomethyl-2-thiouridine(34) oxidoreductase MnmC [Wenzhouxiangellaceae bacterium]